DGRSTFMFYFPFYLLVLIGPVMYFYFRSLANVRFRLQEKDAWHLLPGAAVLAIYLTVFLHDVVVEHWLLGKGFPLHFATQGYWSMLRQEFVPLVDIGLLSTMI
ncbi:hypothetical protein RZS08_59580, partial [Arthrospira platensis SPKY1]|nr:hypothetical protein [Arthrospira platensis SPKY1]